MSSARVESLSYAGLTFLVLWKTEKDVPSRNKNHVVLQIFALYLSLLHDHDISLEYVEHGLKTG